MKSSQISPIEFYRAFCHGSEGDYCIFISDVKKKKLCLYRDTYMIPWRLQTYREQEKNLFSSDIKTIMNENSVRIRSEHLRFKIQKCLSKKLFTKKDKFRQGVYSF